MAARIRSVAIGSATFGQLSSISDSQLRKYLTECNISHLPHVCATLKASFQLDMKEKTSTFDQAEYKIPQACFFRCYEKKKILPQFPFGFGLSSTSFKYANLTLSTDTLTSGKELQISMDVTNTGSQAGQEVA